MPPTQPTPKFRPTVPKPKFYGPTPPTPKVQPTHPRYPHHPQTHTADSFRFMSSSFLSLVDNLSEGLHSDRCTDCEYCLDYMVFKDDQLIFRCFECKNYYNKDFNKELIKRFVNMYEF